MMRYQVVRSSGSEPGVRPWFVAMEDISKVGYGYVNGKWNMMQQFGNRRSYKLSL